MIWQGQSTRATISRTAAQRAASEATFGRGPSAMRKRAGGRAPRMAAKTRSVTSGRLKMMKATGDLQSLCIGVREDGDDFVGHGSRICDRFFAQPSRTIA